MAQLDKIRLSGTTYDIIDSTAVHSLDGYYTTGETNAAITAATNALAESIAEQGYQTSGDVQNAISGKADTTAVTEAISAAVSGKVDTNTYTAYTAATDTALGNKADTTAVTESINEATSGKVDTSTYTAYTADTATALAGKADISDIPSVTGYADSVMYNTTSKYVEFYHGTTAGTKVYEFDASPFLIDGMVESVVITSITSGGSEVTVLEITWNSAAGGQVTDIPLTEIFDASNYYTKSEVDTALGNKADLSAATVTMQETGSVTTAKTSTMVSVSFNYNDGVYYLSGNSSNWTTYADEFSISYSDGTTTGMVSKYTSAGETEDYIFTKDSNTFTLQTKGTNKITDLHMFFEEGSQQVSYTYSYSRNAEVAASTAIENTILPGLANKADITAVTQSINEAVSGKVDTTAMTQAISEATSGKADTTAVTAVNDALTAHTADTTIHVTSSDKTTWNGKQDALVSGTNIKTINGSSVLGSGDLTVDTGLHAEVQGTTLIFS